MLNTIHSHAHLMKCYSTRPHPCMPLLLQRTPRLHVSQAACWPVLLRSIPGPTVLPAHYWRCPSFHRHHNSSNTSRICLQRKTRSLQCSFWSTARPQVGCCCLARRAACHSALTKAAQSSQLAGMKHCCVGAAASCNLLKHYRRRKQQQQQQQPPEGSLYGNSRSSKRKSCCRPNKNKQQHTQPCEPNKR